MILRKIDSSDSHEHVIEVDAINNVITLYKDGEVRMSSLIFSDSDVFIATPYNVRIKRENNGGIHFFISIDGKKEKEISAEEAEDVLIKFLFKELDADLLEDKTEKDIEPPFTLHSYFEFSGLTESGNPSHRFWEIYVKENKVITKWGRVGGKPKTAERTFRTKYDAAAHAALKMREKKKKGYRMVAKK